jgi:hypothetical protein
MAHDNVASPYVKRKGRASHDARPFLKEFLIGQLPGAINPAWVAAFGSYGVAKNFLATVSASS